MDYIKKLYSGRIGRKNYLLGLLFFFGSFVLLLIMLALLYNSSSRVVGVISTAVVLFTYIVHVFSLPVRRFHDLGDSGWLALLSLIPLVNFIILVYLLIAKGEDKTNQYGEIPLKDIKFFDAIFNQN